MSRINELIGKCKCSFALEINNHRDYYMSVEDYLTENPENKEWLEENVDVEVYNKMKELNTIVEIQFYPDTPNGFYRILHYDLDQAIEYCLSLF